MLLPYLAVAFLLLATLYSAIVSFGDEKGRAASRIFPQPPSRFSRILVGSLSLALLAGTALWMASSSHNSTRRPSRFLIPEGYTGWVRVEFEVPGAAPLPNEAGQYVIKIPPNGSLQTSSPEQYGWAKDGYDYYSAQGTRSFSDSGPDARIWGKLNAEASGASGKRKYEEFFVGTRQQFMAQANQKLDSK